MVSKFQKVINFLYKRFVQEMGREPATPKEIMDIQDEAVRHFNKTKGVPQGAPKPSFQGFKPTVIEGGKPKEGIEKAYDKFYDKTGRMRDRGADIMQKGLAGLEKKTLLRDSPEAIAKIKADNKAAAERLRNKKKTVEDFRDEDDWDPGGMASGGRIGYAGGQLVKGARWFLKSLKDTKRQLAQLDLPIEKKTELLKQADDAILHIESGGPIPEQIIQHIRKDPKFRSVSQGPRSGDPDLAEMEEVILEYGQRHASGGLAYMLGEPNTRTEALREFGVVTDPWGMYTCLLYTSPSPRDRQKSRMPSSA